MAPSVACYLQFHLRREFQLGLVSARVQHLCQFQGKVVADDVVAASTPNGNHNCREYGSSSSVRSAKGAETTALRGNERAGFDGCQRWHRHFGAVLLVLS